MTDQLLTLNKSVKLKPYIARTPKPFTLMSDEELLNGKGGTLISDTESYPNYFLAAFKDVVTGKIVRFEAPFNEHKLQWVMCNYRMIGFNWIKYDQPMLWAAYKNQDTERLQEISGCLIYGQVQLKELLDGYKFHIHKTNHIDLIEVCPLKGSLKLYSARIHAPRIQDVPFDVREPLTEAQKDIIADYNLNDLDETEHLFNFMKDRLDLRQSMSIEYHEDLMSKSDAQIAEAVISREVYKATKKWPKRPVIEDGKTYYYTVPSYINYQTPVLQKVLEEVKKAQFIVNEFRGITTLPELSRVHINKASYDIGIGGLHSKEKIVAYVSSREISIVDRDVRSYYPRIILNLGLYPEHIGKEFLTIFESLTNRRLEAVKANNKAADKGLKVTINGTGGKFNDQWSKLRDPSCFIHMTLTGQLTLLMLIEAVELAGIQVISANTDGIVMLCPQSHEQVLANVIREWEQKTGFQTEETRYQAYFGRDVNAYFAVKFDGTVKVKGPYSEVGSTTGTQLDNNPASLICSDAVKLLLAKNIPIEKTIYECQDITRFVTVRNVKGGAHKDGYYLGKVIRWYYARDTIGTINYILSGNKVPDTDGAKPTMDLPKTFPDDVNYSWYVAKTLEILYEIGYYKRPDQIRFF